MKAAEVLPGTPTEDLSTDPFLNIRIGMCSNFQSFLN